MIDTGLIEQEVIHNNKEIYAKLSAALSNAKREILVAVSWFTDPELLGLLSRKCEEGLKIELIIADNTDNGKLDFDALSRQGAEVIRIKNVGYGIMHQKFCVIDKTIALHGSYNWTVNARNNNHESVIITNHSATVQKLIESFHDIKHRAIKILNGEKISDMEIPAKQEIIPNVQKTRSDYESILDSMIAAEVSSFDRSGLKAQGFDRAKTTSGDPLVLTKALDTLYNGFVNDIDIIEDKKRRLIAKIDEQFAKTETQLKEENALKLETLTNESQIKQNNLNSNIVVMKSEIQVNEAKISDIKDTRIPQTTRRIEEIQAEINKANIEFVEPAPNKMLNWFLGILLGGMVLYSALFYSSAAYIMVYMEEDAKAALNSGTQILPGIFEPKAFSKAFEHGFGAVVFITLFVFLPIGLAMISRILNLKGRTQYLSYVGMLMVDGFVAYKVAKVVNEVNNLSADVATQWGFSDALTDVNFWLVMALGALGLVLIKFLFGRLMDINDDKHPDIHRLRNNEANRQRKADMATIENERSALLSEINEINTENIRKQAAIANAGTEVANLPLILNAAREARNADLKNKLSIVQTTTDIYKSHVENDIVPVSVDALKDRINVFLEGWDEFLHAEFSEVKAVEKSTAARHISNEWQADKNLGQTIGTRYNIKA